MQLWVVENKLMSCGAGRQKFLLLPPKAILSIMLFFLFRLQTVFHEIVDAGINEKDFVPTRLPFKKCNLRSFKLEAGG